MAHGQLRRAIRAVADAGRPTLVVAAMALMSAACTGADDTDDHPPEGDPPRPRWSIPDGSPTIIVYRDTGDGALAEVGGELVYLPSEDCFLVQVTGVDDKEEVTPLWPDSVTPLVHEGQHGVEVPGFGVIMEGDLIVAGGEYTDADVSPAEGLKLPSECLADDGFVTFTSNTFG